MLTENTGTQGLEPIKLRIAQILTGVIILTSIIGLIVQLVVASNEDRSLSTIALVAAIGTLCIGFAMIWLIRHKRIEFALSLLIVGLLIGFVISSEESSLLIGTLVILTASIIVDNKIFAFVLTVIALKFVILLADIAQSGDGLTNDESVHLLVEAIVLVLVGMVTRFFLLTSLRNSGQVSRTNRLLEASAEVGQITSKLMDLNTLFSRSVELIRNRFDFYHVQIFLIDEAHEYANLVASTGEAGQQLLARQHRLLVGSQSVIGRVTQTAEPVIARDTDSGNSVHARNELLPNTRAELALPIMDDDQIIGALDVQSTQRNAFDPNDIQALSAIANQIGVAIRNAQLFSQQETNARENKRLFFESETNLREIQRLNQQLTKNAWDSYLQVGSSIEGITLSEDGLNNEANWTPTMIQATTQGKPISHRELGTIAIPIQLRGEVLGAIEIKPGSDFREDDTIEMMRNIAQHLAISLDNARLFEESQESTMQEQRLNNIVGRYQSADSVDELLQITLTELSQTLGAKQGAIRLNTAGGNLASSTTSANSNGVSPNGHHPENGHQQNGGTPS